MLNSSWKVNVSSSTGKLLAVIPNIQPGPQRFASPIVIVTLLLVSPWAFFPCSSTLVRCLHTETTITAKSDQLKNLLQEMAVFVQAKMVDHWPYTCSLAPLVFS